VKWCAVYSFLTCWRKSSQRSTISSYSSFLAAWKALCTSDSPASTEQDSSTAVPDMSMISRLSLRSARSVATLAVSAAAEFCK